MPYVSETINGEVSARASLKGNSLLSTSELAAGVLSVSRRSNSVVFTLFDSISAVSDSLVRTSFAHGVSSDALLSP